MAKILSAPDIAKLKQLVNDGCSVLQEVEDLNTGLNETIKAIAEEMDIKPAQLKKVVKYCYKSSLDEERAKMTEIEDIMESIGRA
jgi:hypothetical protein